MTYPDKTPTPAVPANAVDPIVGIIATQRSHAKLILDQVEAMRQLVDRLASVSNHSTNNTKCIGELTKLFSEHRNLTDVTHANNADAFIEVFDLVDRLSKLTETLANNETALCARVNALEDKTNKWWFKLLNYLF